MPYIELDLMTDPDALLDVGVNYLESVIPGFEARPGNVETVLLEANSQIAAEIVEQVTQIDPLIFGALGEQLLGIAPYDATPAVATATLTWATDTPAVLYPAGSLIGVPSPTGEAVAFATDDDVLAPDGGGTVTVGVTALEAGSAGNDCFGASEAIDVMDGLTAIDVSASSGGTDAEESDDYLARLVEAMTILAPRPILPPDFALLVEQLPDVGRAWAIDLYQPSNTEGGYGTPRDGSTHTNVPRCVTVVVSGEEGTAPSDTLLQTAWSYLDARREVNFLVYTIPPTFMSIDVTANVVAYATYPLAEVEAQVLAELEAWLSPLTVFNDPHGEWVSETAVRLNEAIERVGQVEGVRWVQSITLGKNGGAQSAADVAITTPATLVTAGTLDANVSYS